MDRARVPLVEFYRSLLPSAREAGYKIVLTALAREADAPTFYDDLRRYWTSLHDLTGPDILFVLAGANAAQEFDDVGIRSKTDPIVFSAADLAVVRTRRGRRELEWTEPTPRNYTSLHGFRHGTPKLTGRDRDLADEHTLEVGTLRRYLRVAESQLPCLAVTLLRDDYAYRAPLLIPFVAMGRSSLYAFLRDLTHRLEPSITDIDRTADEVARLTRQIEGDARHLRALTSLRVSIRARGMPGLGVESTAAVGAILKLTSVASRAETLRQECFGALQRVRSSLRGQNGIVADLRRLIDWSFLPRVVAEGFDAHDMPLRHSDVAAQITKQRQAHERAWSDLERTLGALAFSSTPAPVVRPVRVFYGYAAADAELRDALETHLMALRREGLIEMWHDRCVTPGEPVSASVHFELERADIVLLLISADFIASDECHDVELRARALHQAGRLRLIPILLRPVDLPGSFFGHLRQFPANRTPVTQWEDRDAAWTDVAKGLRGIVPLIAGVQRS